MKGKKSLPGAETGADARGGRQLRWKASRYSPLCISVFSGSSSPFFILSQFSSLCCFSVGHGLRETHHCC